jgi:hypothetical protein
MDSHKIRSNKISKNTPCSTVFLDGLCYNKDNLVMLYVFLEDYEKFVNFLEIFAGRSIKIPTRKHLQKLKRYSKLYKTFLEVKRNIDKTLILARTDRETLYKAVRFFEERIYDPIEGFTGSPRREHFDSE